MTMGAVAISRVGKTYPVARLCQCHQPPYPHLRYCEDCANWQAEFRISLTFAFFNRAVGAPPTDASDLASRHATLHMPGKGFVTSFKRFPHSTPHSTPRRVAARRTFPGEKPWLRSPPGSDEEHSRPEVSSPEAPRPPATLNVPIQGKHFLPRTW